MDKKKAFQILLFVTMIVAILFMIFMYNWINTESMACLNDPLQYTIDKLNTQCYCVNYP